MRTYTLEQIKQACKDYGFDAEITAEQCWNEGYRLGRARWYWGPSWFVSLHGWINTQIQKLKGTLPRTLN